MKNMFSNLGLAIAVCILASCAQQDDRIIEAEKGELKRIIKEEKEALSEDLGEPQFLPQDFIFPEDSRSLIQLKNNLKGKYDHLDPDGLVPEALLERALAFYDLNQKKNT